MTFLGSRKHRGCKDSHWNNCFTGTFFATDNFSVACTFAQHLINVSGWATSNVPKISERSFKQADWINFPLPFLSLSPLLSLFFSFSPSTHIQYSTSNACIHMDTHTNTCMHTHTHTHMNTQSSCSTEQHNNRVSWVRTWREPSLEPSGVWVQAIDPSTQDRGLRATGRQVVVCVRPCLPLSLPLSLSLSLSLLLLKWPNNMVICGPFFTTAWYRTVQYTRSMLW